MSGDDVKRTAVRKPLDARQWRQVGLITLGAVALYAGFRFLPTGTNLSHTDFRTGGAGNLEMCDPSNPQFIPVVAVRSPVSMSVRSSVPAKRDEEVRGVVALATASSKPIAPPDLLVAHTRKLHLLIVDATLEDYQHVHPEPGERAGEWTFAFVPKRSGSYRVFGDFVPAATGRGLYASADLEVGAIGSGDGAKAVSKTVGAALRRDSGHAGAGVGPLKAGEDVIRGEFVFALGVKGGALRAGQPAELAFTIAHMAGADVPLQPVMDAFAHLVAFDEARSGFAHLHPNEADLTRSPDKRAPRLTFKITFPQAGRYVIWAQVNIAGTETFVPFWIDVGP